MTEEKIKKHPTEIISEDIAKFTQDIESLHTTLPFLIVNMGSLKKSTHGKLIEFINEHALEKNKGDQTTYSIKFEDILTHDRLKHEYDNLQTAIKLIPRQFVTSLVSQYDSFLSRVIKFIFAIKPELLNVSEKNISYTDLVKFPSIDAVSEYIIEKEVESIIRKSHVDQFAWLKDKLGTPFNKDLKSWPVFVELNERRNLFVHCDGLVSSQYLKVCLEHKCDIDLNLAVGGQLEVTKKYFEEAYKCVYEIGVKLAHVVWRRLSPEHLEESDGNIININYGLIERGEFDLAIRLLDFFTQDHIKHSNDANKRTMIINHAQACKWANNNDTCKKILGKHDWSASGNNFKLAVVVLEEKYNVAYTLMRQLKHDELLFPKTSYKDWPLFKEFRKQPDFASVYEECYGEPFKMQQKN